MEELYLPFPGKDDSFIWLDLFKNASEIPFRSEEFLVPPHQHDFHELAIIIRGSCNHIYKGLNIPLIPGDIFLIPPNQSHSYLLQNNLSMCNCLFYPEKFNGHWTDFLQIMDYVQLQKMSTGKSTADGLEALNPFVETPRHLADINQQGIIHLNPSRSTYVSNILMDILQEQNEKNYGYQHMKRILLEAVLIFIKRAQVQQFSNINKHLSWKQNMISGVLTEIETNIATPIDFKEIAKKYNITVSYFRILFKDVTGLPPVEYLNRLRMLKALEYLQVSDSTIIDTAASVGIYDANYFSRLFKKIIGYPPMYFKRILPETSHFQSKLPNSP